MWYLALTGLLVISSYVVIMTCIHGVQDFVSDAYYVGYNKWLFSIVLVFTAFSWMPYMFEVAESLGVFALIMGFGLCLVGAEPHYKSEHGKLTHYIGAYSFLISGMIWCLLVNHVPFMCCTILYGLLMFFEKFREHPYFYCECLGALGIGLSIVLA